MGLKETKEKLRSLLESGEIRYVIGYRAGTNPFAARPFIASSPEELDKAVYSPLCVGNPVRILLSERKRAPLEDREKDGRPVAMVVKGCDARTVTVLLQEHILKREELLLIGMPCVGVVDAQRAEKLWYERSKKKDFRDVRLSGGGLFEQDEEGHTTLLARFDEVMAPQCRVCRFRNPSGCDYLLWDEVEGHGAQVEDRYAEVERLRALQPADRWRFWQENFSRCIRCNACKNICPLCYCDECTLAKDCEQVIDPDEKARKTSWIDKEACLSNNMAFHMHRAMHLAGRCVDCGECQRVCPARLPLRLLYAGVEQAVRKRFGYEAGLASECVPVLATYADTDEEDFIEGQRQGA